MKMKLVLVTISAAALAVSADCQAMMRRSSTRVAMQKSVAPKVPQCALSFKVKKDFSMPYVPVAKINLATIKKHTQLTCDLALKSRDYDKSKQELKKAVLKKTGLLLAPILTGAAFFTHPNELSANLFGLSYVYSIFSWPWKPSVIKCTKDCLENRNRQKNVENELMDLVQEQKRELKLRDDIQ